VVSRKAQRRTSKGRRSAGKGATVRKPVVSASSTPAKPKFSRDSSSSRSKSAAKASRPRVPTKHTPGTSTVAQNRKTARIAAPSNREAIRDYSVILHLSDIHRTNDEPVSNAEILLGLRRDIETWAAHRIPKPDFVVISGDLTQSGSEPEYIEAEELIRDLMETLDLAPQTQLLIVPGNHDVHWPTSEAAFRPRKSTTEKNPALVFQSSGLYLVADSEDIYQQRLANFRSFYERLTEEAYPKEREKSFSIRRIYTGFPCSLVGLSSCDINDAFRKRGFINPGAIAAAASQIAQPNDFRIAVWHHDLNWRHEPEREDFLNPDCVRHLAQAGFHLGLCGHTHRGTVHNPEDFTPTQFPIVSAGSLCAGTRERGDSVPRLYNIVEISSEGIRVHVRAKAEKASDWHEHALWGDPNQRRGYYDLKPQSRSPRAASAHRAPISHRSGAPSPFSESNAKHQSAHEAVAAYFWTEESDILDSDTPQVVLGTRGSGKTALLLTLSLPGVLARTASAPSQALRRVGVYCPLHVDSVSAFTGKGWMPRPQRQRLFQATVAAAWISACIDMLIELASHCAVSRDTKQQLIGGLGEIAFGDWARARSATTNEALRQFRHECGRCLDLVDDGAREEAFSALSTAPLFSSPNEILRAIASEVRKLSSMTSACTLVTLFDEAEHLNEWQQQCIYGLLSFANSSFTTKIATLPYTHFHAVRQTNHVLVEGNDFGEIVLALAHERATERPERPRFHEIAEGIWRLRLKGAGMSDLGSTLKEVFPDPHYFDALSATVGMPATEDEWVRELRSLLGSQRSRKADSLLSKGDSASFGDQFLRKYQVSLRFRVSARLDPHGTHIPRYWGLRTILRACDGNCRWLLKLLDQCWRLYWAQDGLRPLTPDEQNLALLKWATGISNTLPHLPERGDDVADILGRAVQRFRRHLYESPGLPEDAFRVELQELTQEQAQAVALGIGYGVFVPEFADGGQEVLRYPKKNLRMRLGYPYALANLLPLRSGSSLIIGDLSQVTMPWWKD
jgi:3',5'-cyclic AMP phosphodiesterase CpdA